MSDAVVVALIGAASTVVGAVGTVLAARIQAAQKARAWALIEMAEAERAAPLPVLGEAVDLRQLRLLRALYGEPGGRWLGPYKGKGYHSSLEAVLKKGWVQSIEGRYYLTAKGAEFCRAYHKQLLDAWQPADQVSRQLVVGRK
jgi:hypothetical protein